MENMVDTKALYNIGYGMYVITCYDGNKDNGMIGNTVVQVTSNPLQVVVCINKSNYSHDVIKQTGIMNVNCLSEKAPFSIFEKFGFSSGRDKNKFEGEDVVRSENGLVYLSKYINSFMSLKVENYIDMGTHGMFVCSVTESKVVSDDETMSYSYYHKNVKPKAAVEKSSSGKKKWVCKICGYVHEADELPEDFECPICGHGPADFEEVK